jgi:regulator of protease activity HflC (stomatin/prohibitin superfamily)
MTTLHRLALLCVLGCTNPETPAGHEGYVHHLPLIFGKMAYRHTLTGPSSTGVSWRLYVTNIDMRAQSFAEDFTLLTRDNLSVTFQISTRIQLRPGTVRTVVEEWGAEHWYEWNVKEPLRTIVRRNVMEVSAIQIQLQTDLVRQRIFDELVKKYEAAPVEILSVDIGHIEFPKEVTDAIQLKIAKQQELERQDFLLAKTKKEAAIHVLEALKAAKQQRIISATLDPLYVQRRAVQVYRSLASSGNKTIFVLPNTADGTALPMVLVDRAHKVVSPADERLLQDMETRYMKVARDTTPAPEEQPLTPQSAPTP